MSADDIWAISEANQVVNYRLGFSADGAIVIWKLRFADGREDLFFMAAAVAAHFCKGTRRAARKLKWPGSTDYPDNPIEIVDADWSLKNCRHDVVLVARTDAQPAGCSIALQTGTDLFLTIRLTPAYAVQIADMIWEEIRAGRLHDLASLSSPSFRAH